MKIFDLEQNIIKCWGVIDELDLFLNKYQDGPEPMSEDDVANFILGVKTLYEAKFEKMWEDFDMVVTEYHQYRKIAEKTNA